MLHAKLLVKNGRTSTFSLTMLVGPCV